MTHEAARPTPRTGPWKIADLAGVKSNGLRVFSCFHCGGGSSMGYKLAGYEVLGGVEIDPKMMDLYRANHRPRHSYLMGVREFAALDDASLPPELFDLDVLDGSPPCSSFSMAGSREKAWGEKKVFREGQAHQVLDDLFFDFIAIARKLNPRVVVAENVKGLLHGNARGYVKEIFCAFRDAGYSTQLFLLNSARMGVPQARERTFFIANKMGAKARLAFNEPTISVAQAWGDLPTEMRGRPLSPKISKQWADAGIGRNFNGTGQINAPKTMRRLAPSTPAHTQIASPSLTHWDSPNYLSKMQAIRIQTFPDDYEFRKQDPIYVCGMSVPPRMMQRVAEQVHRQLFADR